MFFYNEKQEFIGVDEDGLRVLGYDTFDDLLKDCSDVAELFEKEVGHIHKFQNLSWINFLLHADSDNRLAIVKSKNRKFVCTLEPHKLYLASSPTQNGYAIKLVNIKSLGMEERISEPAKTNITQSVLPNYDHLEPTSLKEPSLLDVPLDSSYALGENLQEQEIQEKLALFDTTPITQEIKHEIEDDFFKHDEKLTIDEDLFKPQPVKEIEAPTEPIKKVQKTTKGSLFTPEEQEYIDELEVSKSYVFDPSIAANELGLPVDLIEEFIGDFIFQAHEFKDELFEALDNSDINNLRILSHKLKGVAANLRIEDAFESLAIVNTSDNHTQIRANLKNLYRIIDKLEGKEVVEDGVTIEDETATDEHTIDEIENISDNSDDIYSFDDLISKEAPINEASSIDDDIYSFDLPSDTSTNDEIYSFDEVAIKEESNLDSPSFVDDEIYSFNLPSDTSTNDEIYNFDTIATNEETNLDNSSFVDEASNFESSSFADVVDNFNDDILQEMTQKVALNYNKQQTAGELGISIEFLDDLISDYKQDISRSADNITSCIGSFDTQGWKRASSELIGITNNLRLNEIARVLQIISQTNDAQEAKKASSELSILLEQL